MFKIYKKGDEPKPASLFLLTPFPFLPTKTPPNQPEVFISGYPNLPT
jgi:hypothetical protein